MQNIFHVPFRMLSFGTILLIQQQLTSIAYPVVEIHFLEMPFFYLVQLFGQLLLADCARLSGKNGNSNTCVYYGFIYTVYIYAVHPPSRNKQFQSTGSFFPVETLRFW